MSGTTDFSYAVSKYQTDIQSVYNASDAELPALCGRDQKGTFGTINGKKTYILTKEEIEKAIDAKSDTAWNSTLIIAATVSVIVTPMLLTGVIAGVLTFALIIAGHCYRQYRFKNIQAKDLCIRAQCLIAGGYIPRSNSLNTEPFIYSPTQDARKHYGPLLYKIMSKKQDEATEAYKQAHTAHTQHLLPFYLDPLQPSLIVMKTVGANIILP